MGARQMLRYATKTTLAHTIMLVDPEEASFEKFKAIFPFNSKGAFGQISLKDGEIVVKMAPDKMGWTVVRNADGEEGGVPTKHLGSLHLHLDLVINNSMYLRGTNQEKWQEIESKIFL